MLALSDLAKSSPGPRARLIFSGVNLELARGEYIAVTGESGVGKSTLLNLIAGLDRPDSGKIVFDGEQIEQLADDPLTRLRRRAMGFVFQAFHVLPYLSVAQNVALPLSLNGIAGRAAERRVNEMLDGVGLADRAESRPSELSGGELQRVAIARALAHRPKLVLADEPTGNLDRDSAAQVLRLLQAHVKANDAAAILVTHSPFAAATTDKIFVLRATGLSSQ